MSAHGQGGKSPTYPSYLHLEELLQLQRPLSRPEHPDELLFIVVHQASELWFRVILHELDGLYDALERRRSTEALWRVGRLNGLMRIVAGQLSALDTLPPQRFAQFRGYLGTSSGSQSAQFRAIEAASGLRDEHFMRAVTEHGSPPPEVSRWLERSTLQDLFGKMLDSEQVALEDLYVGPGPTTLFLLAEGLLDYEQQFARWRFLHVQLVERVIGPATQGTGGTLGSRYLSHTVSQKFFPRLWEVRTQFFRGDMADSPPRE